MKQIVRKSISAAVLLALIAAPLFEPYPTEAAVSGWQKGVSIASRWNTDFSSDSFKESVRNAKAMGVTHVTLVIPYMQDTYQSSNIYRVASTPSDETLGAAIDYIHGQGMKAVLKPHLEVANSGWRALIEASDRDAWYRSYGDMLNRLADVAKSRGADMIVIGTELIGMASPYVHPNNTDRWKAMIAAVRSRYSGPLTYSANWGRGINHTNEFEQIGFWPELDYIGVSAYFDLNQDWNNNSVESFKSAWQTIDQNQIQPLQAKYGKAVLFSEIGYKSTDGAHTQPWEYNLNGNYNSQEQVNLYQALFEYWNNRSYLAGISIWQWSSDPNYGGQGNTDYTPRNKPAEATIKSWFGGSNPTPTPDPDPTPTPTPTPAPTGSWSSSGSLSGSATVGSSATLAATVNLSGEAQNVIADVEIYDSSNSKIFQKFFERQNISQSAPGSYSVTWTPPAAGAYTLKIGTFSNDWSANHHWNDRALAFSATNPGETPPPTSTTTPNPTPQPTAYKTDIWWPTNGASVGGTQPFKAMLQNKGVSEYRMYWQVDGRELVEMWNSDVDYPHKEFHVDLSGWNWNSNNRYIVNFVSKDLSGNTISEGAAAIYVAR
ncbi:MAG: hypothetical protein HZA81_02555 [Candidatus Taylorbacteria bacterium]|nr:hypothetical protein [Candidatus Taylorbacteria bacterium]